MITKKEKSELPAVRSGEWSAQNSGKSPTHYLRAFWVWPNERRRGLERGLTKVTVHLYALLV
jgi:hypothetical protein